MYGIPATATVNGFALSNAGIGVLSVVGNDCSTLTLDVYDATADSWTTTHMGTTDWNTYDIVGIDDGRFLVFGGRRCSDQEPEQRAMIVDPATGSVNQVADVPIPLIHSLYEPSWTGQWVIRVNGDGRPLAYEPAGDRWFVGASVLDASGAPAGTVLSQSPGVWFESQLVIASPGYDDGGFCCRTEHEAWTYRLVPAADG